MRPTRKILRFDEDSVKLLFSEIHHEAYNIRARITRLFVKWESQVKESGDIAAIGEQVVKLIAAEAKNQDQKIMLLKILKEIVSDKKIKIDANKNEEMGIITASRRNELLGFIQEETGKRINN